MAILVLRNRSRIGLFVAWAFVEVWMQTKSAFIEFASSWLVLPLLLVVLYPCLRDFWNYWRGRSEKPIYRFDHGLLRWRVKERTASRIDGFAIVASIVLILGSAIGALIWPPDFFINGQAQVTDEIDAPWEVYRLNLVGQEGRVHQLGRCPGPRCLRFISEGVSPSMLDNSQLAANFRFEGMNFFDGHNKIQITANSAGVFFGSEIGPGASNPPSYVAAIGLFEGAGLKVCSRSRDFSLFITSAVTTDLRMELKVKGGSYDPAIPSEDQCKWMES